MVSTEISKSNRESLFFKPALLVSILFLVVFLVTIGDRALLIQWLPGQVYWVVHVLGGLFGAGWLIWLMWPPNRTRLGVCAVLSGACLVWWPAAVFVADATGWEVLRASLARWGTVGLFVIGLAWFIWFVDRGTKHFANRPTNRRFVEINLLLMFVFVVYAIIRLPVLVQQGIWNPFRLDAWYYGRRAQKLRQSMAALGSYSLCFLLTFLVLSQMQGCQEIYEMPAGGGEPKQIVQTIKVKKVIRKKFVVNPYSSILFRVPNIDETVNLNLNEVTKHRYEIGYGQGKGAGFAGGTFRGKVRFIRLEYSGGDWNQDFGIGGDLNMLTEYGIRTKHKIEKRTESRKIVQLKNFPTGKSPPLVYITGEKNVSLSKNEIKILREYLNEKHGMIFADNGGSRHWENQFYSMMSRVLPDVRPVSIPLDDVIHRVPYPIPFLPFVAPHGARKEAIGWYKDGRWLCYYHPGDIGDAWADGHAGVKPEVWEACYQLGTNVIFYAHAEYSKWLEAQKKK